jgi:acyl-coenzyme A thioesterase PaaI-like protein
MMTATGWHYHWPAVYEAGTACARLLLGQSFSSTHYCFASSAAAATLIDVVGSAALVTLSDKGGVSLAINTLYLNPMPGEQHVHAP